MSRSIEYQGSEHGYVLHSDVVKRASLAVALNADSPEDGLELLEMVGLLKPLTSAPPRIGIQQKLSDTEERKAAKAKQARERRARRRAEGKKPN